MSNGISNYKWLITIRPRLPENFICGYYYTWGASYKEYEIIKKYHYVTKQKAIDGWKRFAKNNKIDKYEIFEGYFYGATN